MASKTSKSVLLGQGVGFVQFSVSEFIPLQSLPPCAGAGFAHFLSRVLVPSSQDEEQSDHFSHKVQLPST